MRRRLGLLAFICIGQAACAETTLLSETIWTAKGENFGGYSGLELSSDGLHFTTITDRGILITTGTLTREDGVITGVADVEDVSHPNLRVTLSQVGPTPKALQLPLMARSISPPRGHCTASLPILSGPPKP